MATGNILGFSRRQFIDFSPRRDFFTLLRRHVAAFAHFGGVPLQCLYDSEKTVVLLWEAGRPLLNTVLKGGIMHKQYQQYLQNGMKKIKALVAIARKLLGIMFTLVRTQKEYD